VKVPGPVTLNGQHVRLEPLAEHHAEDLFEAGADAEVWRWLSADRPADPVAMRGQIVAMWAEGRVPFATVLTETGRPVGSTSYLDVDVANAHLEIGYTWIGRPWWRTAVNTEAKLLMLDHAFDELGAERVSLKTDHLNLRSQAAIERLGAVREGVLRHRIRRRDGSWRDTVCFSILAAEWPAARARLGERMTVAGTR